MSLNLIFAMDHNKAIGKNNLLPWHIPEDLDRFRKLTSGQIVVMGKKTWDSLPVPFRPLPNRTNIVITTGPRVDNSDVHTVTSLSYFLELVRDNKVPEFNDKDIWFIGGKRIIEDAIKFVDYIYITIVDDFVANPTVVLDHLDLSGFITTEKIRRDNYTFYKLTKVVKIS